MGQLINDIKYYIELRIKKVKLGAVENLSTLFGKLLSLVAFIFLAMLALLFLSGVFVILLEMWLGSWLWAFLIVAGVYLIAALIFYFTRETMFTGSMVKVLSNMFFGERDNDDEEEGHEED